MKIDCCVVRVTGRSDNWLFCREFLCFPVRVVGHRTFPFRLFPMLQNYSFIMFGIIFLLVIALSSRLMESLFIVFDLKFD